MVAPAGLAVTQIGCHARPGPARLGSARLSHIGAGTWEWRRVRVLSRNVYTVGTCTVCNVATGTMLQRCALQQVPCCNVAHCNRYSVADFLVGLLEDSSFDDAEKAHAHKRAHTRTQTRGHMCACIDPRAYRHARTIRIHARAHTPHMQALARKRSHASARTQALARTPACTHHCSGSFAICSKMRAWWDQNVS